MSSFDADAIVNPATQVHSWKDYHKDNVYLDLSYALRFRTGQDMLGIQLSEASQMQCKPEMLDCAHRMFSFADASLVINWPGRPQSLTKIDTSNVVWDEPDWIQLWKVAKLVADEVHEFLRNPPGPLDPGTDLEWYSFGKYREFAMKELYLVELRLVGPSIWQPVLAWSKS